MFNTISETRKIERREILNQYLGEKVTLNGQPATVESGGCIEAAIVTDDREKLVFFSWHSAKRVIENKNGEFTALSSSFQKPAF